MRSIAIENYKKTLELSSLQQSLIVGTLLGDGHLETRDCKKYRLKIEQGIDQQVYVWWKYDQLKELVGAPPRFKTRKNKDRIYQSLGFTTYSLEILNSLGNQFYVDKKKVIPKNIERLLDPFALAVWFMDDGSHKGPLHQHAAVLHTLGYSFDDLERMQRALVNNFGLETKMHRQGNRWRIYIPSKSHERFCTIIEPYTLELFSYKLRNIMPKK